MLRHLEQHGGGVLVYTYNLLRELLALDSHHELVLLCQEPTLRGLSSDRNGSRVRQLVLGKCPNIIWDQWRVLRAAKEEKFDLIFNPKYSLPLVARCPTVFVCHGLDWYIMPWGSKWADQINHHYLFPRYAQKANAIIAVSNTARHHLIEYLGVKEDRVHTVYLGVDEAFSKPISPDRLEQIGRTYALPNRFFLYCGQIYPPKNFGRLIKAYAQVGPKCGISLVVAGTHTWLCKDEIALNDRLGLSQWVAWRGWIDHETLSAFYALAEALVLPSLYESFGLPILEAMSSGCPVVTANRHGTLELAEGAAVLVNPEDVESIADGMWRVVTDQGMCHRLKEAGLRRAKDFSWEKCATETIAVLEEVGATPRTNSMPADLARYSKRRG